MADKPTEIKYSYRDVPTIERFSNSNSFIRGIRGPFGSGKSSGCAVELVNRGLEQRPGPDGVRRSRFAVIRNTMVELRDTTIKTIVQWFPPHYFGRYVEGKHTYTIKSFPNCEIEIIFLALDRPEDISKLLSLELTGAWVNEAREVPWAIIEALQGRVGRYPAIRDGGPTWSGIWLDTNPPDSDSWWYRLFAERTWLKDFPKLIEGGVLPRGSKPKDYAEEFSQPSGLSAQAENLANLTPGYYVKLSIGKSDEWNRIYVHGEYGYLIDGKAVYTEYNDGIHCQSVDPVHGVTIIRSWDFGLTPACAFSQMLPDGRWLVFDEMTSDNMSIDEFSDDVIEHCNRSFRGDVVFEDWGDPAGEQRAQTDKRTCFEIMRNKGIMIEGSIQNPQMRQESVRKPLRTLIAGEPQFILHPRCKQLRKGMMGGYHRRRLRTSVERYSDQVEKNMLSHICESLEYGMVQYFAPALTEKPREDDFGERYTGMDEYATGTRDSYTGY